jgi:transposase-like protein
MPRLVVGNTELDGSKLKKGKGFLKPNFGVGSNRFPAIHSTEPYENNRAEQSHEATRARERGMRKFKSVGQSQRFLGAHAAVSNLFNLGRHLVRAKHYRDLRVIAFEEWGRAVA